MRNSIFLLLPLIFLGVSCAVEHDKYNIEEEVFTPITNIELSTLVISVNIDEPFSCVVNDQVYTNERPGVILIEKLLLEKEGNVILIKADGYFDEVRYVVPSLGAHECLEVDMTRLFEKQSFNAKEGGMISIFRLEIDVGANSIVDAQGDIYDGEVSVALNYTFDGAFASQIRKFPQNLKSENGELSMLHIIDGYHIVMRDEMMNSLYLKEGSNANIRFEIPGESNVMLPDIVEMRSYDFENGTWEIMGEAEKNGDLWHGIVTDLGFINWGIPYECRVAQIKLRTEDGHIIPNKFIWLVTDQSTPLNIGFSDSKGIIRMHAPLGKEFRLTTFERFGNTGVNSQDYAMVDKGQEEIVILEDFLLTSEAYQTYNGGVVGCYGDMLNSSALVMNSIELTTPLNYESYFFSDENGLFDFALTKKNSSSIAIKAFDFNSNLLSSEYTITNDDENFVDFGNLLICEEFESFINYNIDGKSYAYAFDGDFTSTFSDPIYKSMFTANALSGADEKNRTTFTVEHEFDLQLNATYDLIDLTIRFDNGQDSYSFECDVDCKHTIALTKVTTEFYEGLIRYTDSPNSEVIIGAFRLPKQ